MSTAPSTHIFPFTNVEESNDLAPARLWPRRTGAEETWPNHFLDLHKGKNFIPYI